MPDAREFPQASTQAKLRAAERRTERLADMGKSDLGRPDCVVPNVEPSRWRSLGSWMLPRNDVQVQRLSADAVPPQPGHPERVGICCSGGGLRSASFAFGGMQALWDAGILAPADYLAGVSGGSYAVTAATILRVQSDDIFNPKPQSAASGTAADPSGVGEASQPQEPAEPAATVSAAHQPKVPGPFAWGSPELDYLRNRTDYLAPGLKGQLNMLVRVLLGIAFNVAVIFATAFVIGRVAGWLYGFMYPWLRPPKTPMSFTWWQWGLVLLPVGIGLLTQMIDLLFRPAQERVWRALVRVSGLFLALGCLAAVTLVALPAALYWLRDVSGGDGNDLVIGGPRGGGGASVLGALTVIAGSVLNLVASKGVDQVTKAAKKFMAWPRKLLKLLSDVLLWIVGPLALLLTLLVGADGTTDGWTGWELVGFGVTCALLALLAWQGNPIAWSLQPFYKRRLRSVFCLQRSIRDGAVVVERVPEGSEPALSDLRKPGIQWPELVICAAVNISDLGWTPPRTGVSGFTFSPTEIGGHLVGYIPTADYELRLRQERWFQKWFPKLSSAGAVRDVNPLSAVSISGAAISPSMGRQTRPALRMMMTLLNLRLGVWLPNPRAVAVADYKNNKGVKLSYLGREMTGSNRMGDRFLYVSDGGHYENLGLVELLRLGCTQIWCLDASGDRPGQLRTLGQAETLARAELGVEFDPIDIAAFGAVDDKHPNLSKAGHAIINFRYPCGREGQLVYIRKALDSDAPTDLLTYQVASPAFPYDGTGDQFYDFEQFEAYRRLGVHNTTTAVSAQRAALSPHVAAHASLAPDAAAPGNNVG